MSGHATYTKGDHRVEVRTRNNDLIEARLFRSGDMVATTTDMNTVRAWLANPEAPREI